MYDALILVNGEIPRQDFWSKLPFRVLICTDGAAGILHDRTLTPDVIIGDMDSIADSPLNATVDALKLQFPKTEIIKLADQNTTDFEKSLIFSEEKKFQRLLCVGILGKSADHSVYNLSLLARFGEQLQLLAVSTSDNGTQWIFPLRAHTTLQTEPNHTLSFLAFPEATLTTNGLQWELNNTHLSQVKQHSVRNKIIENTVHIQCQGHCLAFLTSPTLPKIEYEDLHRRTV